MNFAVEGDPLIRAKEMRQLARVYHALGFNIVPLGADKRPVKTGVSPNGKPWRFLWDEWQNLRQSADDLKRILAPAWWTDVYGIAGICGFNGFACLDFDSRHKHDPDATGIPIDVPRRFADELGITDPWLVKTPSQAWHLWMRTDDIQTLKGKLDRLMPDEPTVDHVELRWFGHYVALPGSHHPRGDYEFAI